MITNLSSNFDKIKLHGYNIIIKDDKVEIYVNKKVVPEEFKPVASKLVRYLMDEMFISPKPIRVEVLYTE